MGKGAAWMVAARILDRGIGLASIVVLARLLVPADFGLVAMATVVVALLELFVSFGFDTALIQHKSAERRHYDTAWTFNVIFGALMAAALLAAAAPTASFYGEPRLEPVVMCLAAAALIQGFENIGTVEFRKELRFRKEFGLIFARRITTFAVTIPLAIVLRNYWALVIGIVVSRLASLLLTYWVHEYRPRFSLAARAELFRFGKWLVLTNMLNFLGTKSADILVGKIAGARELGLFSLSYEIANLPTSDLIAPINRAIFPGYAKKAADPAELKASYLQVIGLIAVLLVPAGTGIAAIADLLVPVALGVNWIDAIPAIVVLSFFGVLFALKSNNHYVYLALGKPNLAALLGTVHIAILLPMIAVGSAKAGAFGVAVGYLVAQALFTPFSLAVLRRALGLGLAEQVAALYRPFLAAAAMYAGVRLVANAFDTTPYDGVALLGPLLACVATGAVLYALVLYLLWAGLSKPDGAERRIVELIQARIR
jgi:O-antigen/teichoic acid export membrane protein